MMQIQFPDRLVSYDTFMADLSNRIAERIVAIKQEPEVISQRMAYRQYGRANVQRWVRQNKVHPCKRVGRWNTPLPSCARHNLTNKTIPNDTCQSILWNRWSRNAWARDGNFDNWCYFNDLLPTK